MKQLRHLLTEIIPVVIGILIALFINNWNEDRKDQKYLDQIFTSIDKELEESIAEIERVIPKQQAALDTLNKYMDNEDVPIFNIMIKGNGIHYPLIKTNSWNAIANSKIELVDYEQLSALADIQEAKENLWMRNETQMEFMFQNFEETSQVKKTILSMMALDIINAEKETQEHMEEILERRREVR